MTLSVHLVAGTLLAVSTVALSACGSDPETGEGTRTFELTADDAGGTLSVRPGDGIVITLDSNATTGFAWELTSEPAGEVLELVGSEYGEPETDLVGSGGEEVWRFRALTEGTTSFTLTYMRSFSGETAGEPFDMTVVVQPAS